MPTGCQRTTNWRVSTMIKCPLCQFENEDGALFCEQCKSDLGMGESAPAHATARSAAMAVGQGLHAAVSEVSSPHAAVAFAEAAVNEAVPVAQVDAGAAAA